MTRKIRPIIPISEQIPAKIAATTGITLFLPDGTRYFGIYYTVNGQYITTPTLTNNTVILTTIPKLNIDTDVYDKLKGDVAKQFISPVDFIPTVTELDLTRGYIQRYFVTKRNEPGKFVEISEVQYNKYGTSNLEVIDGNIWKRFNLRWLVNGDIESVKTANRKTVAIYELEDNLTGLSNFLFKLDEFYLGKR